MSLALGSPAPDFRLRGVDGAEHALEDYSGSEILVLVQSCNHCPYVLAWEDRLMDVQRDYQGRGVTLVAFNSNDGGRYPADAFERMVEHAAEKGFPFHYLHDPEQMLAHALGAERTPEVFVFDRARRLVYHGLVDDNRDDTAVTRRHLREALEAVLAGGEPSPADTTPVGCTVKWLE